MALLYFFCETQKLQAALFYFGPIPGLVIYLMFLKTKLGNHLEQRVTEVLNIVS